MDLDPERSTPFGRSLEAIKVPWLDKDVGLYDMNGFTYWGMTGNCPACRHEYPDWEDIVNHFPCELAN